MIIDPIKNQQGPWTALDAYLALGDRIADFEENDSCDCREFDPCPRCIELGEMRAEQNRLKSLFEDYWIKTLWKERGNGAA